MKKVVDLIKRNKLEIIVFVAGCIEMSLELVAARVFSPHVGSTTSVWTIIIGMILVFMSAGYIIGGKQADKEQDIRVIAKYAVLSALWIALIPFLEVVLLQKLAGLIPVLEITAFICCTCMFGIPCMLLAAISPYAVKLKEMDNKGKENLGKTSGRISSFSTVGSIIGTFMTGFVLLPLIGAKTIILSSSIILLLMNICITGIKDLKKLFVDIILIGTSIVIFYIGIITYRFLNPEVIKEVDSRYARIQLLELNKASGNPIKLIKVGNNGAESVIYSNGSIGSYTYYFDLAKYFCKDYSRSLLIGGAAFTYPTYFYSDEKNKDIKMDVVEIDPAMIKMAIEDFDLDTSNPSLKIITQDARSYINFTDQKYDAIFMDAFKGDQVPFELTTVECVHNMKEMLNDNGIIIVNMITAITGKDKDFLHHEYATYKR